MNPPIGLCYGCLTDTSLSDLIEIAGRHGFASIMVYQEHWKRHAVPPTRELSRMLEANGIRRVTLDGVLTFLPRIDSWAKSLVDGVDDYFRMAEQVGATCFNVPHYTGDPATPLSEMVDALGPFAERAARHGIALALEFMPETAIPDLAAALRLRGAVGASNLGICVDTWHLARTGGGPEDLRALPPGAVTEFQINDRDAGAPVSDATTGWQPNDRKLPGEGQLPLVETILAVEANAPGLPLNVEVFSEALRNLPPDEAAARVAAAARDLLAKLPRG
ncbi:MAG TPA: sugar phosphate isomerase/epimerase family protein [Alphaproteobacteria bacterium]|nr:sugar phosphate isomerase/epimerase family protein [Alphaproteobacteria bacterium]